MRVFPQLCMRARLAGATSLVFTAELEKATIDIVNGVGTDDAWSVTAYGREVGPLAKTYGRTGEEALRRMVEKLEKRPT